MLDALDEDGGGHDTESADATTSGDSGAAEAAGHVRESPPNEPPRDPLDASRGQPHDRPASGAPSNAPPASLETPARWDIPRLKAYFGQQDSRALAKLVRCPVLLVHCRADPVVPFGHSVALAAGLAGDTTLLALAQGTHSSAQHDPVIHRLTVSWLLEQVRIACTGRT